MPFLDPNEPLDPPSSQGDGTPPAPAAARPAGRFLDPSEPLDPPPAAYSGSILPFTTDPQGNTRFDIHAGLLGKILSAVSLPGDVWSGKQPVFGPTGGTSPELVDRSLDLASLITPVNPAMRAGDRAIPGELRAQEYSVPGGWRSDPPVAVARGEQVAVPSAQELKDAAATGYTAARGSGIDIKGDAVGTLGQNLQTDLQRTGIIAELAPKTFAVLNKMANPPALPGGSTIATIADLEAMRRVLTNVTGDKTEERAAALARDGIDKFLETLTPGSVAGVASPTAVQAVAETLGAARGNYAAAMRSNELTGTLDRAVTGISERALNRAAAANSGRNLDNAIRQRVESMLEKPREIRGFSDAEVNQLQKLVAGGALRNTARYVGNVLGGGGGWGQVATAGIGGAGGMAVGGGPGAAIGAAALPAVGAAAKTLQNHLAWRRLAQIDEAVRARSPLVQQMVEAAPALAPGIDRRIAALRYYGVLPLLPDDSANRP